MSRVLPEPAFPPAPFSEAPLSCLTDEEALASAQGLLSDQESARVMAHVSDCAACRMLVVAAAQGLSENTPAAVSQPNGRTLALGDLASGRYRITRFLGAGGMGEVYEAIDTEFDTKVALKTLGLTRLDDPAALAQFKAEVQLARRVTHPNVCRIFDFGVHGKSAPGRRDPERVPFLTMELLLGETLGQRLKRCGRMSVTEAWPIVEGIMDGLEAAHAAGVVHRDLKCDNVFLTNGSAEHAGRVVLMDFGLARPQIARGETSLTSSRGLVGTVAYMSPEQVEGRRATFGSDIYALGVVLYEVLTGTLPFSGVSPVLLAAARLHQQARPPHDLAPELPVGWNDAVMICLAREPQRRFASIAGLREALFGNGPSRPRDATVLGTAAGAGEHDTFPPRELPARPRPSLRRFLPAVMLTLLPALAWGSWATGLWGRPPVDSPPAPLPSPPSSLPSSSASLPSAAATPAVADPIREGAPPQAALPRPRASARPSRRAKRLPAVVEVPVATPAVAPIPEQRHPDAVVSPWQRKAARP
jgi:serine/threonine protein kinase